MNQTIIFSNGPSTDDKNKSILIISILFIVIFLSIIVFIYIYIIMPKKKINSKKELNNQSLETPLWRNAIIKNDINLADIYQKNTDKNVILNPIIENI
jgi:flagellar basal body-associated protein FliL